MSLQIHDDHDIKTATLNARKIQASANIVYERAFARINYIDRASEIGSAYISKLKSLE